MIFNEVTEQEFNEFIAAKPYKHMRVNAGTAQIDVYYDEPNYNPSLRDAFRTTHPGGISYHVKVD